MKRNIKKSAYLALCACLFSIVFSCEKEFTDIGSNVITNTKFDENVALLDIEIENSPLERIQSDNITVQIGQYLLGVLNNPNYEKVEASIVSQLSIPTNLSVASNTYGNDTTVVTHIDTVFLKLPYQVTLNESDTSNPTYTLDSIIGDVTRPFNLNVYRSNTFLNRFNPSDPSKLNTYFSDQEPEKIGSYLNEEFNFQMRPNENDTILAVKRRLFDETVYATDTIKFTPSTAVETPIPFARIPLNKEKFKELFLDKYETGEFSSQETFNDYFRGLILEATGNDGSLIAFNFTNSIVSLNPSIEVYYSNTVLAAGSIVVDTISKNDSFPLSGFRFNTFKTENRTYPVNNEVKIQGVMGSEATIKLFDQNKIEELRANNWLINDAALTVYVNQSIDTSLVPFRLSLYKSGGDSQNPILSQVKDAYSEAQFQGIGGALVRDGSGRKEKYVFKLTDYVSDILNGETNYLPDLKVKVYNVSDLPFSATDTIFTNYSWNPKAVTIFNGDIINGDKKAVLKISYSEKK